MPPIPERTIDEIIARIDIVEFISSYIPLKRVGRNYKALCPFHHEKTASFIVSPERQIFHCFGCGVGGNVFSFVMQYERIEFPEAVEVLARKANVVISKLNTNEETRGQSKREHLYKINEEACKFYSNILNSKEGLSAPAYLKERGISKETIIKFKIGYATDKWDGLINYLRAKNIPLGLIEKTGLIISKEGGGYYDRFRNRIIVPIVDIRGRIIGFGGRVLDNSLPKYVNSPETPVYSKGKNLFGLNVGKDAIRLNDVAVVVEGYFDLIIPHQAGIENIIASCGTALTSDQIRLLKRYSNNVIMVYDADSAGQMATLRSFDFLIEEDLNIRIAALPEGYDPDSYLRKFGVLKFRELLNDAKDIFDYKLCILKAKYGLETIVNKARIVSEMLSAISRFNNAVTKSEYIKKLSEELRVDEGALLIELKKAKKREGYFKQPRGEISKNLYSLSTERLLVKLMLQEQDIIARLKEELKPVDFQDRHLSQIVSMLFNLFHEGERIEPNRLVSYFPDSQTVNIVCELSTCECPELADKDKIIVDCIQRIQKDKRRLKQHQLHEEIKLAQMQNDQDKVKDLLKEFQLLTKKVK